MSLSWQIPRNCLAWILVSQLALLAPHVERLPWWVMAAYVICAGWRVMVYQGRWSLPPKWLKVVLAGLCFVGIYQTYGRLSGLEPTVALLFSGFCLKLLEIANKRDVYLLIFLAYFVAVTSFLFSQAFFLAAYIVATVLMITTALVALHQHGYDQLNTVSLKKSALIMVQAVPIMLLLFVVFPRFDPFWSVPSAQHQAKTGISSTMSPGDISKLSRTGGVAFRVEFEGDIPPKNSMYWRGLVLSEFDGRTWKQGRWRKRLLTDTEATRLYTRMEKPIRYSVTQEPTYQRWLFSLALAYSTEKNIRTINDFRLIRTTEIFSRIKYNVVSDQDMLIEPILDPATQTQETQLPDRTNPAARQLAQQLWLASDGVEDYIQTLLLRFRQQEYVYTLNPPLLGEDAVDEFLFDSMRGFCSHYASSFVFLMRAVGIPARVVVGYQGGEVNPLNGTVIVHQFDAHSWAEVWIQGRGWVRVDPTAAVAPQRIEFGLEQALQEEGSFLQDSPLSPLRYRDISWINELRLQLDALNYYWVSWVLQYDADSQFSVMKKLLGEVTPFRVGALIFVTIAFVIAVVAMFLLRGRGAPKSSQEVKIYLRLCRQLEKAGYRRRENEGAIDFARRVADSSPAWKQQLLAATRLFVTISYDALTQEQKKLMLKELKATVSSLGMQLRLNA